MPLVEPKLLFFYIVSNLSKTDFKMGASDRENFVCKIKNPEGGFPV